MVKAISLVLSLTFASAVASSQEREYAFDAARTEAIIQAAIEICYEDDPVKRRVLTLLSEQYVQSVSVTFNIPLAALLSSMHEARSTVQADRMKVRTLCQQDKAEFESLLQKRGTATARALSGDFDEQMDDEI